MTWLDRITKEFMVSKAFRQDSSGADLNMQNCVPSNVLHEPKNTFDATRNHITRSHTLTKSRKSHL